MIRIAALHHIIALPKFPESPHFWTPVDASTTANEFDWLYDVLVLLSAIFAAGIFAAMLMFCFKYRARSRAANETVERTADHNTTLEIAWSFIPLVILIALFVWGFKGYVNLRTTPRDAMEVRVTGQKWKWLFDYPNGVSDDALHVPVDTSVRLVINAVDVLHSFYVPNFRVKMDAVPGRYTELWFHATQIGEFPVECAEYCGTSHSDMLTRVVVHSAADYQKWLEKAADAANNLPPVELGKVLYEKQGCSTCHTIDGTRKVGPSFKGLWGRNEVFSDGSTLAVDENYIRESILQPQAKIVQGYSPAMPTFQGKLKDKQIAGIIEFIKSLK